MIVLCALGHQGTAAAKSCAELDGEMTTLARRQDVERARRIVEEAATTASCVGAALDLLGRRAAFVLYAKAYVAGVAETERENLLEQALKLGRPWQVVAAAADLARTGKRHAKAAQLYQEALDDIRNERLNPAAPSTEVIAGLIKKAEAASLLAPEHVRRIDRSGAPGGLACLTFRGFTVRKTAVPVEFEYDEPGLKKSGADAFTAKGRGAAEDLFSFLTRQGAPAMHLIGHTDPIGGDAYNQKLSERRAAAVRDFLIAKGYKGDIRTSGKGKTEPFEPDDPQGYTTTERHQLDRRVELDRQDAASCTGG
jgi:outer membrane protein OmpA-like peptidoglycan-associated protein